MMENFNLFDVNGIKIEIGDKYTTHRGNTIYTVFWKGGAMCGGLTFDDAEPLCWDIDNDTDDNEAVLIMDDNLNWIKLITTNEA